MVGSAVETENSSRADRKRQIHIEAKISRNLTLFSDDAVLPGCESFSPFLESWPWERVDNADLEKAMTEPFQFAGWSKAGWSVDN